VKDEIGSHPRLNTTRRRRVGHGRWVFDKHCLLIFFFHRIVMIWLRD
jgi:hypothetical protein